MKNNAFSLTGVEELNSNELNQMNGGGLGYILGYIMGSIAGAYENLAGNHPGYVAMTRCYNH